MFKGSDVAALVYGYAILSLKPPKKHLIALQILVYEVMKLAYEYGV